MLNAAHWRCFDSSSKNSSVNARGGAAMVGIAVFRRSGNVGNVRQPDPRSFFDRGSENRGTLEARRNVIHQPANLPSGLMVEPFLVEDRSWRLARSRRNAFHVFRSRFHVQEPRLAIGNWRLATEPRSVPGFAAEKPPLPRADTRKSVSTQDQGIAGGNRDILYVPISPRDPRFSFAFFIFSGNVNHAFVVGWRTVSPAGFAMAPASRSNFRYSSKDKGQSISARKSRLLSRNCRPIMANSLSPISFSPWLIFVLMIVFLPSMKR